MRGSHHRTAGRADMAASAKVGSDGCHVHLFAGAQADLIFLHARFVQKDGTFYTLDAAKLAHNPFQILRPRSVKVQRFPAQGADHAASVHEADAFQKRPSQNLGLQIGLFKKGFLDQTAEIKAERNQISGSPEGVGRSTGILEASCIMHDSHVERLCDLLIQPVFSDQAVNQLAGGTGLRVHKIHVSAAVRIADVMIDVDLLSRRLKIRLRLSQPVGRAVQSEKNVKFLLFTISAVHILNPADAAVDVRRLFQEHLYFRLRKFFFQIKIQPHTGSDAVSVRADMPADADSSCSLTFFQKIHRRLFLPPVFFFHNLINFMRHIHAVCDGLVHHKGDFRRDTEVNLLRKTASDKAHSTP